MSSQILIFVTHEFSVISNVKLVPATSGLSSRLDTNPVKRCHGFTLSSAK